MKLDSYRALKGTAMYSKHQKEAGLKLPNKLVTL